MHRKSVDLLSILKDGIEELSLLDAEDDVLVNALNLCLTISGSSSGFIIRRTREDKWRIDGSNYDFYIPSDIIKNNFCKGALNIDQELIFLLPADIQESVNTVIPVNIDGTVNTALLFHSDNNIELFAILALFLSSILSRLNILHEITEIRSHYEDIVVRKEEAERLASLGFVAAGLAHEIKNPLVSIKTLAQLLPERYDDQEFRFHFTNIAINEIDRISNIVSDLLDFAKTSEPSFTTVNIQDLIDEVIDLLSARFEQSRILISKNYSEHIPAIKGDRVQLKQLLLNIFLNSQEAIKTDGVINICLTSGKENNEANKITIRITDTGTGIEKEDIQHVFDPFFTTKDRGTGLGLSICKRMVSNHGGRISLDSIHKQGTSVTIELPVNNAT